MPPPSKPRPSTVERGGAPAEDDPERNQHTQAKIKVPDAPKVSRGSGPISDDPERNQGTQAQIRASVSIGSPEAGEDDPEKNQHTQAKVKLPVKKPDAKKARAPS